MHFNSTVPSNSGNMAYDFSQNLILTKLSENKGRSLQS